MNHLFLFCKYVGVLSIINNVNTNFVIICYIINIGCDIRQLTDPLMNFLSAKYFFRFCFRSLLSDSLLHVAAAIF